MKFGLVISMCVCWYVGWFSMNLLCVWLLLLKWRFYSRFWFRFVLLMLCRNCLGMIWLVFRLVMFSVVVIFLM